MILTFFAFTVVLGILGFLLGAVAVVLGAMARKEIQQSYGKLGGMSMATAGLVLGIIGLIINLLIVVACVACVGVMRQEGWHYNWNWNMFD